MIPIIITIPVIPHCIMQNTLYLGRDWDNNLAAYKETC